MNKTIAIEEISKLKILPAFENNNIPICLFSSNDYAPFCGVLVTSIIANSKDENNYDILIFERNITLENKRLFYSLIENKNNFSIRFFNMTTISKSLTVSTHSHFALEGSLKLYLLTEMFSKYDKFVAVDSDLVFNKDVADLYAVDLEGYYMAAVDDVIMKQLVTDKHLSGGAGNSPKIPAGEYIKEYLGMQSSDVYYNTGVIVLNLKLCREHNVYEKVIEKLNTKDYWFIEQDVLNEVCFERTKKLDLRWNVLSGNNGLQRIKEILTDELYEEFILSLDDYYVMHFAGNHKPWFEPTLNYADRFFKYARISPWYEQIIFNMNSKYSIRVAQNTVNKHVNIQHGVKSKQKRKISKHFIDVLFPPYTKRREELDTVNTRKKDKRLTAERKAIKKRVKYMYQCRNKPNSEYYENYQSLKSLKNIHQGKRCFIIGNGPSLKVEDLNLLKNEITFGMNSVYKAFDLTDWRPTYYVTNDIMLDYKMAVPASVRKENLLECLSQYSFNTCLISSSKYNNEIKEAYNGKLIFLPTEDYLYQLRQPRFPDVPRNCEKKCLAFGTTAFLIYQLAVYMGFEEIYFVGTDCNYSSAQQSHFYDNSSEDDLLYKDKKIAKGLETALLRGFCAINRDLKKSGVKVYNATRGGNLEIFPRVDFDSMFK